MMSNAERRLLLAVADLYPTPIYVRKEVTAVYAEQETTQGWQNRRLAALNAGLDKENAENVAHQTDSVMAASTVAAQLARARKDAEMDDDLI